MNYLLAVLALPVVLFGSAGLGEITHSHGIIIPLFLFTLVIAAIPARIAENKGRDFVIWWAYGAMLWIIALIHALVIHPTEDAIERTNESRGLKTCPECAEAVKEAALKCRHCGYRFDGKNIESPHHESV